MPTSEWNGITPRNNSIQFCCYCFVATSLPAGTFICGSHFSFPLKRIFSAFHHDVISHQRVGALCVWMFVTRWQFNFLLRVSNGSMAVYDFIFANGIMFLFLPHSRHSRRLMAAN